MQFDFPSSMLRAMTQSNLVIHTLTVFLKLVAHRQSRRTSCWAAILPLFVDRLEGRKTTVPAEVFQLAPSKILSKSRMV
jgi:hypothetical protein